ncbi:MAG: hypothetical protein LH606_05455 [Cytophagaceae bacterium]|nr:hypothetical protein [Cytophagaceae bacterium]
MKKNTVSVKTLLMAVAASAALTFAGTTSATAQSASTVIPASQENPLKARVNRIGESLDFDLRFENPTQRKVTVQVVDQNANTIYKDVTSATAPRYARRLDLSNLEDGTYTFVISNGKDRFSQAFEIRTQVQTSRLVVDKQ